MVALTRAGDFPAAANRFLIGEADLTRRKRAAVVDRTAATLMLQAALDASRD